MAQQSVTPCAVFLLLILVFLSGALVFLKGFLLTRTSVELKSACETDFAKTVNPPTHKHEVEGCWMHGRFKRAIVIIIDALRHDFVVYNESLKDPLPYQNKFPTIDYLVSRKPLHSRLYKFKADPPTTTMQRLKGLTTGSLPTFVDVSSNFQGYEITEDNLINQLKQAKRKITFLGDDTWLGLFPDMFKRSFDFPSFDVKDLHTVDNGILKHLFPEMRREGWDVLIAHFLGVDHCGHRYGPNHPSMADKLSQMDTAIRRVTNLMKNDTILFLMGDHGMTRTGDHGGDSDDELMAGMFIYSPSQLASSPQNKFDSVILQTDFVPTFSLLLGLPIPFSNLGMAIPELFGHCPWWHTDSNEVKKVFHRVKALRLNVLQVDAYLDSYQKVSSDLPRKQLRILKENAQKSERDLQALMTLVASGNVGSETHDKLLALEKSYISYLMSSRKMCENVWAKFDLKMMSVGIASLVLGIVLTIYFFFMYTMGKENDSSGAFPFIVYGTILYLIVLAVHVCLLPPSVPPVMVFVISLVLIFICFVSSKAKVKAYLASQAFSIGNVVACLVTAMSSLLCFSNSFVVHEDRISLFLLQTLLVTLWIKVATTNHPFKQDAQRSSRKAKSSIDITQYFTQPSCIAMIALLLCSLFLRFSSNFYDCREEQHDCSDSFFLTPLSNLDNASKNQRYILSIFCMGVIIFLARYWLKHYGNLNGSSVTLICLKYGPPMAAVFTSLHWAFQTLPASTLEKIPQWQQVIMAQIVYVAIIASLTAILVSPLLVFILPSRPEGFFDSSKGAIPSLYNQIKLQMNKDEEETKPPMVYGLGSVYSASIVTLCLVVLVLLCLLLNDGVAPSMLCGAVSLYLALELYSASITAERGADGESCAAIGGQDPDWLGIVLLSMFSTVFFYATGHQATIANLRFEAAFVGFYGDFNNFLLPGFLVWTNTFASHIFFSLASPLLIFWPRLTSAVSLRMIKDPKSKRSQDVTWHGDFELFNDGILLRKKLFQLFSGSLLFYGIKMLSCACAATIHRRHLMVWKIFAPRLIYEVSMFATTSFYLCLAFLFVLRVDAALARFVKTLPSSQKETTRDETKEA